MRRSQRGLTTVEFAVVGTALIFLLFALIEFGRVFYTFAALGESTRRAARLAAVCPIGSPQIVSAATAFGLTGFSAGNVSVQYLDATGTATANYANIQYVQVSIVGYSIPLEIPVLWPTVPAPSFAVTVPRESLGVSPTDIESCT